MSCIDMCNRLALLDERGDKVVDMDNFCLSQINAFSGGRTEMFILRMGMRSFVIMFFHTAVALLRAPVADVRSFIGYDASDSFKLRTPLIAHGTSFAKHLSAFPRTADVLQGTFDPPGTVVLLVERVPRLKSPMQPYLL